MIRTVAMGEEEPGVRLLSAALEEEGFDDLGSGALVESFARHLMVAIDAWQESGLARSRRPISPGSRPSAGCAATSTTTAISSSGAWRRRRTSAARSYARSPSRRGSIPQRGPRR
jgi:hypothetical protein